MTKDIKRIVILPYFGKFNSYFDLWLTSCKFNVCIDWLIVTDCEIKSELGNNIRVIKTTFEQLKDNFQKKFDFKIKLNSHYKLCDYKPLYGYLFSDLISDYDFWGYCDCDLVFGDLDNFLQTEWFENYDKILRNGHLSFVKNTTEINEVFQKFDTYRVVFKSPAIYNYDESVSGYRPGFAGELLKSGYRFYQNSNLAADIKYDRFPFYTVADPETPCVFSYENGKTYRITRNSEKSLIKEEVMYFHLQKRKMEVNTDFSSKKYIVYPNVITDYNEDVLNSDEFWTKVSTDKVGYFDPKFDKKDTLKRDILRFIYEPNKIKSIKYRFSKKD